jgi:hypothetical protein
MMAPSGLAKGAARAGVAIVFGAMFAVGLAPSGASAGACAPSIPTCGCTISSPGSYTLTGSDPMNSTSTCVDITASNVSLVGSRQALKGPGPTTSTFGVHIEPTANKVFLNAFDVEGFGQGIRVDGPNATVGDVVTTGNNKGMVVNGANAYAFLIFSQADNVVGIQVNSTATDFAMMVGAAFSDVGAGIKLNGVNGAFIDSFQAGGNGTFGIWLKSASNNAISDFSSVSNGLAGVYLGCNPTGPNGTACPPGMPSSNGNSLMGNALKGTAAPSDVSNSGSQRFGIAIGLGSRGNRFTQITGSGNLNDDALDENPNCANNRWLFDSFTTSSPAKNTTFFCLN